MLAAGVSEEVAAQRLEAKILITAANDDASQNLKNELVPILKCTLHTTNDPQEEGIITELIIGHCQSRSTAPRIYAILNNAYISIGSVPINNLDSSLPTYSLFTLISACYVAGAVIFLAVGDGMPNRPPKDMDIPFSSFIDPAFDLNANIDIEEAYLAGAGAIGNGFLWAARHLNLYGKIHVVDDDIVSSGNLQRQIWFSAEDIGEPKAKILSERAQEYLPNCQLIPSISRLQNHKDASEGAWLKKLIVAVDSRRARRELQNELPREVFDASTTGSQEIVLHYNRQPNKLACMGCLYSRNEAEINQEEILASHLGIEISDIHAGRISIDIARKICKMHPQLIVDNIIGLAFDTLYKQLCSSAQLKTSAGKQVIAPFAFVSILAGCLLLLEVCSKTAFMQQNNEWRLSPWHPPIQEIKQRRLKRQDCECCSPFEIVELNNYLWEE